ncbi:MAG TPA: hydrolase [Candidatus Protoclostridium stercorigallinarum]|uniref:Hydrolase n=1 Tax=Candidatus Protoclostridium stercorigallinarum TaxID=2838741 RepID=A0A9D1PYK6_9FIRM|nr:hydrolase [Candidatus Protoclostridium stercorigallinarum]
MDSKEEFLKIFDENITRPGADGLRKYLLGSDFFTAPASGRFHCCHEGGLCEHSINVYKRLLAIAKAEYGDEWESRLPHESIAICGLLHDVCKIGYYKEDLRNVKNENGEWIKVPYYTRAEELPYGHGEKSVYIVNGFIRLTRAEALAINWHMGGFDARSRGGDFSISEAYAKYPLCVLLHVADLEATYLDEKRGE